MWRRRRCDAADGVAPPTVWRRRRCGAADGVTPPTVWRHLRRWSKEGVWARIWPAARAARAALDQQGKLDWSMAVLDGSVALAKNGGEKVGLTKKGKGATWMLVVEGNGLPPGFYLDRATPVEIRLADATLDYPLGPSPA